MSSIDLRMARLSKCPGIPGDTTRGRNARDLSDFADTIPEISYRLDDNPADHGDVYKNITRCLCSIRVAHLLVSVRSDRLAMRYPQCPLACRFGNVWRHTIVNNASYSLSGCFPAKCPENPGHLRSLPATLEFFSSSLREFLKTCGRSPRNTDPS